MQSRPLKIADTEKASLIDKKWFGEYGISSEELVTYIQNNPQNSLGLFNNDVLEGFATFEILENEMPKDYVGKISYNGKALFLSNFTTTTNYEKKDYSMDTELLKAVEEKAKELGCHEVWEGLSVDHPYKEENNPAFDAYGFYVSHGFTVDKDNPLAWEPNPDLSIRCYLFRKVIS